MTDNKAKRQYWGITFKDSVIFTGTFNECWDKLLEQYGHYTVESLRANDIRISRIK